MKYEKQLTYPTACLGKLLLLCLAGFFGGAVLTAQTLNVNVQAGNNALPDYESMTTYVKVDLQGIRPDGIERVPLNIALVIDRSGSMSGQKIADARNSAIYVIQQLHADDIVSVITYSDSVEVLIPATKVLDKAELVRRIQRIQANGSTALFAGVSKGAAEVRKFMDPKRINRVILLSDGLANVGPSSVEELGQLGGMFGRERISVSTLGIGSGYNEDLMTRLAYNSDGNHVFVNDSSELADVFNQELGELFGVTAKEIRVRLKVSDDLKILRFLGREGSVRGNQAEMVLQQVADQHVKYVMMEVQYDPALSSTSVQPQVWIDVEYVNPFDGSRRQVARQYRFERVADAPAVAAGVDRDVMRDVVLQIATINSEEAVRLRDERKLDEAGEKFSQNAEYISRMAVQYDLSSLAPAAAANEEDAEAVFNTSDWDEKRKQLREEQNTVRVGQSVGSVLNRYLFSRESVSAEKPEEAKPKEEKTTSAESDSSGVR